MIVENFLRWCKLAARTIYVADNRYELHARTSAPGNDWTGRDLSLQGSL